MAPKRFPREVLARLGTLAASPCAPVLASAALAGVLGWEAGILTWRLLPPAPAAAPAPYSAGATTAATAGHGDPPPRAQLARMHLFGQPRADEPEAEIAKAPETQLDLALKGLFVGDGGAGHAIIAVGGGAEEVYEIGDILVGDTTVAAIRPDGVLIRRSGAHELLRMQGAPVPRAQRPRFR